MCHLPVTTPSIPAALEKHPRFRKGIAAARSRAAAVPPSETLIDRMSDQDWNAPDDGASMLVGQTRKVDA